MKWSGAKKVCAIVAVCVFALSVGIYRQINTPEKRLQRDLALYARSERAGDPRPDLMSELSAESVPTLVRWLQETNRSASLSDKASRLFAAFGNSLNIDLVGAPLDYERPELALTGFQFLGSKAAAALPELCAIVREQREGADLAFPAMVAVREPALAMAEEFAKDHRPVIRVRATQLVGSIRMNRERSLAILLPLLEDPSQMVRANTYAALAEFPGRDLEAVLLPRLPKLGDEDGWNVAYALHTGSVDALVRLIDFAIGSTNGKVRASVLGALATRDQDGKTQEFGRTSSRYTYERNAFSYIVDHPSIERALPSIRSNVMNSGEANVVRTLVQMDPQLPLRPSPKLK